MQRATIAYAALCVLILAAGGIHGERSLRQAVLDSRGAKQASGKPGLLSLMNSVSINASHRATVPNCWEKFTYQDKSQMVLQDEFLKFSVEKDQCLNVSGVEEEGSAYIEWVSNAGGCPHGKETMEVAVQVLDCVMEPEGGKAEMHLQDAAYLRCPGRRDGVARLDLKMLSIIQHGHTFYEQFGFKYCDDDVDEDLKTIKSVLFPLSAAQVQNALKVPTCIPSADPEMVKKFDEYSQSGAMGDPWGSFIKWLIHEDCSKAAQYMRRLSNDIMKTVQTEACYELFVKPGSPVPTMTGSLSASDVIQKLSMMYRPYCYFVNSKFGY